MFGIYSKISQRNSIKISRIFPKSPQNLLNLEKNLEKIFLQKILLLVRLQFYEFLKISKIEFRPDEPQLRAASHFWRVAFFRVLDPPAAE